MFLTTKACRFVLLSLLALPSLIQAQSQNLNPTGEGCIDPTGFLNCYSDFQSFTTQGILDDCAQYEDIHPDDEYQNCILAYGYLQLGGNIGCWIQSCWNMLYSCEYQGTCIEYMNFVEGGLMQDTVNIPGYPPPENGSGRCSCNIGEVYGNITAVAIEDITACDNYFGSEEDMANCQCCVASQQLSNVFDLCPNSDISWVTNPTTLIQSLQQQASSSQDNCAILNTNPGICQSRYGLSIDSNQEWLNPFNIPAGIPGSQPLSDLPGAITRAPATIVLDIPFYTSTIVPVNGGYNPANGAGAHRREHHLDQAELSWIPHPPRTTKTQLHTETSSTFSAHTVHPTAPGPTNTETLNCPTKTSYTVPASCPPVAPAHTTERCNEPFCPRESYIAIACDCPDKHVYTEYIALPCPTAAQCGNVCGNDYVTIEEICTTGSTIWDSSIYHSSTSTSLPASTSKTHY